MSESFAERLPPDTVARLEGAAHQRFAAAEVLRGGVRRLDALYFYGYSTEMWLCAAYFRNAGFGMRSVIDRDTRHRRMTQARRLQLMNSDPHPLVGWARLLEWQRSAGGPLPAPDMQRLREAVTKASQIYNHWRPELRYKVIEVTEDQLATVRGAAGWFRDNHGKLAGA